VFLAVSTGGMGSPIYVYGVVSLYILSFYLANWSEFYTHKAITKVGEIGVTEVQFLTIAFL